MNASVGVARDCEGEDLLHPALSALESPPGIRDRTRREAVDTPTKEACAGVPGVLF